MYNLLVWLHDMKNITFISDYSEFRNIVMIDGVYHNFEREFNRWNESNGIQYSALRIKPETWIIYPNNNNGVQITKIV